MKEIIRVMSSRILGGTLYRADRALKTDYKMRRSNKKENFENTFQAKGTAKAQQPEWD